MRIQENRDFIQEQRDRGIRLTNNSGKALEEDEKIMGKIRRMVARGDRELTIGATGEVSRGGSSGTELQDTRIRPTGRLPDPPPDPPPSPPSGSRRYNPLDEEFTDIDLDAPSPADTRIRRGGRLPTDDDEEAERRRRIQEEMRARRARTSTRPQQPRRLTTGFMPSMTRAYGRLVEDLTSVGTELTNIRDLVSSTGTTTSAPAPDDPARVADIRRRAQDMGLGDHIRIGADGTATTDANTFRIPPNAPADVEPNSVIGRSLMF